MPPGMRATSFIACSHCLKSSADTGAVIWPSVCRVLLLLLLFARVAAMPSSVRVIYAAGPTQIVVVVVGGGVIVADVVVVVRKWLDLTCGTSSHLADTGADEHRETSQRRFCRFLCGRDVGWDIRTNEEGVQGKFHIRITLIH